MLSPLPSDPPSPRSAPCGEESRQTAPAVSPEDAAAAARRLEAAVEALDRAIASHIERRGELSDQEAEFFALQEDRSRLACALDAANTRIETLQENQIEAARRVERARAAVRAILAASPGDC
jgi:predicted  nucleic acid-binding Zn-ribbon protein